jgi:hypothetical protein
MSVSVYLMWWKIDSFWDTKQKKRSPNRHSVIPDALSKNKNQAVDFVSLCLKDGRDIDIHDGRKLIENLKKNNQENNIVIIWAEAAADVCDLLHAEINNINCLFWCPLQQWNSTTHVDEFNALIGQVEQKKSGIFFDKKVYTSQWFRQLIWQWLLTS